MALGNGNSAGSAVEIRSLSKPWILETARRTRCTVTVRLILARSARCPWTLLYKYNPYLLDALCQRNCLWTARWSTSCWDSFPTPELRCVSTKDRPIGEKKRMHWTLSSRRKQESVCNGCIVYQSSRCTYYVSTRTKIYTPGNGSINVGRYVFRPGKMCLSLEIMIHREEHNDKWRQIFINWSHFVILILFYLVKMLLINQRNL